jgi:hypothetical protein
VCLRIPSVSVGFFWAASSELEAVANPVPVEATRGNTRARRHGEDKRDGKQTGKNVQGRTKRKGKRREEDREECCGGWWVGTVLPQIPMREGELP